MRHRPAGRRTLYQSRRIWPGYITCSRQSNASNVSKDWSGRGSASVEPTAKSIKTPLETCVLTSDEWQRSTAEALISTPMIRRGRFSEARKNVSCPSPQPKSSTSLSAIYESGNAFQLRDRESRRQASYASYFTVRCSGPRMTRLLSSKHMRARISIWHLSLVARLMIMGLRAEPRTSRELDGTGPRMILFNVAVA